MSNPVMIVLIGAVVVAVVLMLIYNSLVGKKNQVENAMAGMDVQLKKRYDLIPNLVAAVREYMKHEAGVLTEVTKLRSQLMAQNINTDARTGLENQLTQALRNVMVSVERYPELKASTNFLQLQTSLNEIEEQLSAARRFFNSAVTDFNNAVEMFPTSLLAGMMNYRKRGLFEIPENERKNVNVKELFS